MQKQSPACRGCAAVAGEADISAGLRMPASARAGSGGGGLHDLGFVRAASPNVLQPRRRPAPERAAAPGGGLPTMVTHLGCAQGVGRRARDPPRMRAVWAGRRSPRKGGSSPCSAREERACACLRSRSAGWVLPGSAPPAPGPVRSAPFSPTAYARPRQPHPRGRRRHWARDPRAQERSRSWQASPLRSPL